VKPFVSLGLRTGVATLIASLALFLTAGPIAPLAAAGTGLPTTVVAWGYDGEHQAEVPNGLSNVTALSAGEEHNLAL
jgi:hypothetical protein